MVAIAHGDAWEAGGVVVGGEDPAGGDGARLCGWFSLEAGGNVCAVYGAVGGDWDVECVAEGGEPVCAVDELVRDGAGLDGAFPANDAWDAVAAFVDVAFHAAPWAWGAEAVVADGVFPLVARFFNCDGGFWAVVAGEDDDGVVVVCIDFFHECAD